VDEDSFNALYAAVALPLWRYVARVSGRFDIADDILQEAFFRFLGSSRSNLAITEARPYLFRTATNLLNDRWRRGEDAVSSLEPEDIAIEMHPDIGLDAARVLHKLKPRARELLWLAYVEGMTHREIAQVTGLNTMSVRIMLLRARREAAALLEPKGNTDAR
jgi:RNA polymerase sigma-70 factor, ECF subfamily